jgi:protein gp37
MGQNSEISWTTHTANLWWGCVEVSPLCDNCYAREWAKRYDRAKWGAHEPRLTVKGVWNDLKKWQRDAAAAGRVDRVFVGSMMDIFEKPQPVVDAKGEEMPFTTGALRDGFFKETVPDCPNLLFLLLTKRPQNIGGMIPAEWHTSPPANVMFGCSVGDQATAKANVPHLLKVPGRRFLSIEPLLGPVDLRLYLPPMGGPGWMSPYLPFNYDGTSLVEWVIVGGESGPKARPMHPAWAQSIRDLCQAGGVAFHFKQWGEHVPWDSRHTTPAQADALMNDGRVKLHTRMMPDGTIPPAGVPMTREQMDDYQARGVYMLRVGKKAAGRMLDGRTHDDVPTLREPSHA